MSIKVIGAGFGRTGTTSIRAALEELGFGPCYHVYQLISNPQKIEFWEELDQGNAVNCTSFFREYQAIFGFPGYYFYRQIMEHYPNSKVIFTSKDPEEWYEEASNTIFKSGNSNKDRELAAEVRQFNPFLADCLDRIRILEQKVILNGYFQGKFEDKKYAIKRFKQRIEEVKKAVPAERLLIYQVEQGWEPLCQFLNVPVPENKSFPHLNQEASYAEKLKSILDILKSQEVSFR